MPDSKLASLEIVRGDYQVRLYRDGEGNWFIARKRRGRQYEFFCGGQGKVIWHRQQALLEKDPIRLLQIFTLACATIAREYSLAAFLKENHERYVALLSPFCTKPPEEPEEWVMVEEAVEPPQAQDSL